MVVFGLCTLLKEDPNVVSKWPVWVDWAPGIAEGSQAVELGSPLPLLAGLQDGKRHY